MKMTIMNQTTVEHFQNNANTKSSNTKKKKNVARKLKDFPPKPYTDYVIYARLERIRLLQSRGCSDDSLSAGYEPNHHDPLEHPRPSKYQGIKLPPYWYSGSITWELMKMGVLSTRPPRMHRKREGGMSLKELSQAMSLSWQNVDQETADYCKKLAEVDFEKYSALMETIEKEKQAKTETDENDKCKDTKDNAAAVLIPNEATPSLFSQDMNSVHQYLSAPFCSLCSYDGAVAPNRIDLDATYSPEFSDSGTPMTVNVNIGTDLFEKPLKSSLGTFSTMANIHNTIHKEHPPCNVVFPDSMLSDKNNRMKRKSLCDDGTYSMKSSWSSNVFTGNCTDDIHPMKRRASFVCVPEWGMEDAMSLILALSPNEKKTCPDLDDRTFTK
mmetsp:Transcript_24062/g.48244  ORF Transcript_24062/g.48244 Transcript_24062/m.48244 type:complete len:384 (-) Transcript_24062:254-1405(-)